MIDSRSAYTAACSTLARLEAGWRLAVASGRPATRATVLRDRATAQLAQQGRTFHRAAAAHLAAARGLPHDRLAALAYARAFIAAYRGRTTG